MPASDAVPGHDREAVAARLRAAGSVFAEDEAEVLISAAASAADLARMVDQRVAGVPVAHVVGWVDFCGLRLDVAPGVFVPRPRTELLARLAAARAWRGAVVVDLCCGCGAVGAAVAAAVDGVRLYATDIDPAAVACARGNLARYGGRVGHGDLFAPLPAGLRGRVDLVTANLPYVPTRDLDLLPADARAHEPRRALDGGPDGLEVLRRVAAEAPGWLSGHGRLLVEVSDRQVREASAVLRRAGLSARVRRDRDLEATVIVSGRARAGAQTCAVSRETVASDQMMKTDSAMTTIDQSGCRGRKRK